MATAAEDIQRSRAGNRKRVLMAGTLMTSDGVERIRIQDISPKGAHVLFEGRVRPRADVLLKKNSVSAAACVTWVEDKGAGLQFYRELTPEEMGAIFHRD